ncbi:MAG: ferric reductase-like transmembrane domain-containing protein [Azoarcus sp.]|jgi:predicted ferric reductase|nr:ferric reductase-like transmembrane domain-containing protein [Azoarcus sp.]
MKRIKWIYGVLFVALTALWLLAEQPWAHTYSFFELRSIIINYTGILAMGAMSLAMMLAIRSVTVEPLIGGLDKSYRLHKWLGITALAVGVVHWLWAEGVKWAVGWGWLERPARGPRPHFDNPVQQFFMDVHGPAEHIGEWAFYAAAVLILLALIKHFPYRYFFTTHRIIAIAYLVLAFHAVVLFKFPYWQSPVTWVSSLLMIGGTIGAVLSLTRRIGHQRRALGVVEALEHDPGNHVLKVNIQLPRDRWEGHDAGQFAFVSFSDGEGAHPFTISSAWKNDGRIHFHIKELGDYTARLPATLKAGDRVTVEGPYGCFRFESDRAHQIWVAGGIGVTPFMARMEELVELHGQPQSGVDLYYSTRNADDALSGRLRKLAETAGVRLHVIVDGRDAPLNAARLCEEIPAWKASSVWFCGPAGFAHALRQGLTGRGFDTRHFHQELFDMR